MRLVCPKRNLLKKYKIKMNPEHDLSPFKNFKDDIPASIVVFLVAMPLCLGIALASGAPLYSGLISGIIGGIVVGSLSGSALGVSGPAAGLAVIVLAAIKDLGSYELFLTAVVLAGILQILMGYIKAGIIAYYFPSAVIHGMLAGIGISIFMKQIPHAFGYDKDYIGDDAFLQADGENTLSELYHMLGSIHFGAIAVSLISLAVLILWETQYFKQLKFTKFIPGPLVVVAAGILLNYFFASNPTLFIEGEHLVQIPVAGTIGEFFSNFSSPDLSGLSNYKVYSIAFILAVVASLETLLSVEASDKQDSLKRVTPTNRELKAQGVGNLVCGLIGGLPVTQVIVRSSANQQSGGKTKASTVFHGILLLISIIIFPSILNLIPLATLAAILLLVGFKLAKPALFQKIYKQGMGQFIPFLVTVVGILFINLLAGIGMGMVVAIFVILHNNYKVSYKMQKRTVNGEEIVRIILSEDVSFLNKAPIQKTLIELPNNTTVEIDARYTYFIHHDVMEIIEDFKINALARNIKVITLEVTEDKERRDWVETHPIQNNQLEHITRT